MPTKTAANKVHCLLYNGKVSIDFYPGSHRFKILSGALPEWDGVAPISATQATGIIDKSRPLLIWNNRLISGFLKQYLEERAGQTFTVEELLPVIDEAICLPDKRKEEAAGNGTIVHDFAQAWARFKLGLQAQPKIDPAWNEQIINGINAFIDWQKTHKVEFLVAERVIYSRQHNFVGFTDVIAKVDGLLSVVDYKTSKDVYSDQRYQLSGYWGAYEEEFGAKVQQGVIAHFSKETGEFRPYVVERSEHVLNYAAFLDALRLKRREKELNPDRW